jgi:hypothetical protein
MISTLSTMTNDKLSIKPKRIFNNSSNFQSTINRLSTPKQHNNTRVGTQDLMSSSVIVTSTIGRDKETTPSQQRSNSVMSTSTIDLLAKSKVTTSSLTSTRKQPTRANSMSVTNVYKLQTTTKTIFKKPSLTSSHSGKSLPIANGTKKQTSMTQSLIVDSKSIKTTNKLISTVNRKESIKKSSTLSTSTSTSTTTATSTNNTNKNDEIKEATSNGRKTPSSVDTNNEVTSEEEEARRKLEERRREAREKAAREAELERQRQEELRIQEEERLRLEEERERLAAEEEIRLAKLAAENEQERLRLAIEANEKQEAEKKAREEAERKAVSIKN